MRSMAFIALLSALVLGTYTLAGATFIGHGGNPTAGMDHLFAPYHGGTFTGDAPDEGAPSWAERPGGDHAAAGRAGRRPERGPEPGFPEGDDDRGPRGFDAFQALPWTTGPQHAAEGAAWTPLWGWGDEGGHGSYRTAYHGSIYGEAFRGFGPVYRTVAEEWLIRWLMMELLADFHHPGRHGRDFRAEWRWHGWDHGDHEGRHHHHWRDRDHDNPPVVPTPVPAAALLFAPGLAAIRLFRKKALLGRGRPDDYPSLRA